MAVLQTVASNRWELVSFDVSTAFLHGKGDGRELGIHPPPELREALEIGEQDQCALDGGAYGRIDAPYLWFCEFRDELIKQGCTPMSSRSMCVWIVFQGKRWQNHLSWNSWNPCR